MPAPPPTAAAPDLPLGVGLASASALFIGSSFIVKKKGLQRAGVTGVRAAAGGFAYLSQPLWWAGLASMGAGEACNVVAYAYAPAAVVTPLGGLSVLVAAVLAHALLGERLTRRGWLGCGLAVGGSAAVVLHAPREPAVASVAAIVARARAPPFIAFTLTALTIAAYLAAVVDPATGRRAPWVPVSICSLLGAVSVCGVKLVALAARLSLSGAGPQFASPAPWLAAAFTAAAVAVQLAYLNRALDAFPAALVTPLYYALFTGGTLAAAACLYGGRVASAADGVLLVAGLATVVTAVVLLHSTEGGGGGGRETREAGLGGGDRTAREVGLSVVA